MSTSPTTDADTAPAQADHQPAVEALHRRMRRLRVALLAAVMLLIVVAVVMGLTVVADRGRPAQSSPEVGFARDMYSHHAQAVTMALMVRNRTAEPLNSLAEEIITNQSEQQGIMLGWLDEKDVDPPDTTWRSMQWMQNSATMAGHHAGSPSDAPGSWASSTMTMPGMATEADLVALTRAEGETKARLFVQLMTRHHKGGLQMAEAYLEVGLDSRLRALAAGIITGQQRELSIMSESLSALN